MIHPEDRVSETRFTVGGRAVEQVGPPVDAVTFDWSLPDAEKSISTTGYDDAGRRTTVTDPAAKTTTTAYDPNGRMATVTTHGQKVTSYGYDAAGQQTTITRPSGMTGSGDPATVTVVTGYDASGQMVTETDPHVPQSGVVDPSTRTTVYTPAGRVQTVTDANGDVITYGYADGRGNRTSRTAKDDAGSDVVETWIYDLADRETSHTMPSPSTGVGPQTTTTAYDPEFGRLATVTDPTGRVETRDHYADGTLKSQTWTRGADETEVDTFWVNHRGWRTKSKVTQGAVDREFTTLFDRAGQRKADTTNDGDTYQRSFALSGAQLGLTYPTGESNAYQHDDRGLLTEVVATFWGITIPFASYTYDDDGQELSEIVHALGAPTRSATYTPAGQIDTVTQTLRRPDDTWETFTAALTYRADGRIGTETVNAEPTITYDYDDAGQITSAIDGVDDYGYSYGTRGNRLTSSHNTDTTSYDINPNGSVSKTTTGSDTVDYFYDEAGRRVLSADKTGGTVTSSWGTIYNTRGLPADIQTLVPGDPTDAETREYDAEGLMSAAELTIDGGAPLPITYQWDTNKSIPQLIDAKVGATVTMRAYTGTRRVVLQPGFTGPLQYQYDAHGSAIRHEPANTNVVDGPKTYDPHGNSGYTQHTYLGYRAELSSGNLLYLRNRNYDPKTGQFTTQDVLDGVNGTPTAANPYHYTDNDPANRIDPMGLRSGDGSITAGGPGAACDSVGGRLVSWGDTGSKACLEPGGANGTSCWPPESPNGNSIQMHRGACAEMVTQVTCARGPGFLDPICRNAEPIKAILTVIAVAALGVATGGLALVAIGGSSGIAIPAGGGALALAGGGSLAGSGAIVLSPAAAGALAGSSAGIVSLIHMAENINGGGSSNGSSGGQSALDYATQPQKLDHIFASKHKLQPLVQQLGSRREVVRAMLNSLAGRTPSSGVFELTSVIGGYGVVIRGAVINGVVRLGTAFVR